MTRNQIVRVLVFALLVGLTWLIWQGVDYAWSLGNHSVGAYLGLAGVLLPAGMLTWLIAGRRVLEHRI